MRPTNCQYLKSHEWCRIENGVATIGISDYAVSHLSDLVFLDLPLLRGDEPPAAGYQGMLADVSCVRVGMSASEFTCRGGVQKVA